VAWLAGAWVGPGSADGGSVDDFLAASCLDRHGNGSRKGKLDLDPVVDALRAGTLTADQRAILRRARARVASGEMPPHG